MLIVWVHASHVQLRRKFKVIKLFRLSVKNSDRNSDSDREPEFRERQIFQN